ncbi:MAG: aromatic ring-hydroxylating dioxygenase subunit alpha [Candidatus Krumholzibacteriota bacterium]|nr:aromatic ring-hydroxylating dioxygenase subunit alpha [Candidatus Krumholzibacteriota bacterium]
MAGSWLDEQLNSFNPDLPIEDAWLPPSSWYTESAFHGIERNTVFRNNWLIAAREDQLRNPGDYVAGAVANEPYVVVRGEDGDLRAFYNVCRHHAAAVMVGQGNADELVCPYHGWTYGLDGSLRRAPELGGVRDFDRDCFGLMPMKVTQWGTFVFVCMGDDPRSLDSDLTELLSRVKAMNLTELNFIRRVSYTIKCNWKVYVDNYLDGGYHVAHLHKGLAGQLDLDSYRTEIFDRYSIQSGAGSNGSAESGEGADFAERIGEEVLYAWIYPNFMINRYGSIMDTNWVMPRGADETEVIFDYYFLEAAGGSEKFVSRSLAASDVVQQEDVDICESVQRGLESSSYDKGRYSVKREMGEFHFHRLLAADFGASGR